MQVQQPVSYKAHTHTHTNWTHVLIAHAIHLRHFCTSQLPRPSSGMAEVESATRLEKAPTSPLLLPPSYLHFFSFPHSFFPSLFFLLFSYSFLPSFLPLLYFLYSFSYPCLSPIPLFNAIKTTQISLSKTTLLTPPKGNGKTIVVIVIACCCYCCLFNAGPPLARGPEARMCPHLYQTLRRLLPLSPLPPPPKPPGVWVGVAMACSVL